MISHQFKNTKEQPLDLNQKFSTIDTTFNTYNPDSDGNVSINPFSMSHPSKGGSTFSLKDYQCKENIGCVISLQTLNGDKATITLGENLEYNVKYLGKTYPIDDSLVLTAQNVETKFNSNVTISRDFNF